MGLEQEVRGLKDRLKKLEGRVSKLEGKPGGAKKPMAITEFFNERKPTSGPNQTLTIAYYLQVYKKLDSFTISDLKKGFSLVKATQPGNLSDIVNKNIRKGYIDAVMEEEDKKPTAWYVTESGCKYVKNGFKKKKEV